MELNQTPIRTSQNYGINSIKVKSDFIFDELTNKNVLKFKKFNNFNIINENNVLIDDKVNTEIDNFLSLEHEKQLKDNFNFKLNL